MSVLDAGHVRRRSEALETGKSRGARERRGLSSSSEFCILEILLSPSLPSRSRVFSYLVRARLFKRLLG